MNLELDEEYGAGFEGTKALLYKYLKDTPGQKIIKYMDKKNISEVLKKSDPIEVWIRDFIDSDDIRFAGKTKEERIQMALGAYYAAQKNESADLEENSGYVATLHTKYKFLRRQADEAEEKYKKAKERKLDDDSLETYYTAVRTLNDRADDVYDAYVDARDKASKNESVELEEVVDFRTMKDANLKQWLKRNDTDDSVSPVFGAQILAAKKEAKRRGIDINEGKIPVTEVKSSANLKVGDSVKVTLSSGTTNWSTGKTTRPEVTAKGIITKIADTEQSIHAGDIAKEYTVKYKSSLTGKTETSRFRHVMPESAQVEFATELEEAIIDVKKYECGSEKSQFGGYRPHILNKETGKTMYLGQASYNTQAEAKGHAENYLKQYAQGIQHPKVPVKGTYVKEGKMSESVICEKRDFKSFSRENLILWLQTNWTGKKVSTQFRQELDAAVREAQSRGLYKNIKIEPQKTDTVQEGINIRDYMATSEKSQFGGYRPHVVSKAGKTMYLGQASYNTPDEAKDHAEDYLKQYAQGIQHPKVPIKGTYMKEDLEEINLQTRRTMKIIALATGNTNADALYEYALTSPTYSSLVELKENFNKYIQDA